MSTRKDWNRTFRLRRIVRGARESASESHGSSGRSPSRRSRLSSSDTGALCDLSSGDGAERTAAFR